MPQHPTMKENEVVFEFDQDARPMWAVKFSPHRTYAQAVKGRGYRSFEPNGNKGMCMTMVCKWVNASLANGGSVKSLSQLGDLHLVAITHSAYRRHGADVVDIMGLEEDGLDCPDDNERLKPDQHAAQIVDWLRQVTEETYFALYMEPPENSEAAGHVVGIKSGPNSWAFFDPNYGLYSFNSRQRLLEVAEAVSKEFLEMLQFRFNGGSWLLSELAKKS